ncbi:MAG: nickel pincer cofactor biosynthesis protein LarC [Desulfamplus sp.]|nr:nickel pincer cofactor biosynthesis protein LarC [Desulfamplus sp.]
MIAYFDMFSGISGDMILGAFVDLGVPVEWLNEQLKKIPLPDANIRVENIWHNGIKAVNLFVDEIAIEDKCLSEENNHNHTHHKNQALHKHHTNNHNNDDPHKHQTNHHNNDTPHNDHTHHKHYTYSRNYSQIKELILSSPFSDYVKSSTLKAFEKIAIAESEIHGTEIENVHFHEVGGVDAIADIAGAFLSVEYLGIKKIYGSVPSLGKGAVTCSHGVIPVPAPATLKILRGVPIKPSSCNMENITPTGAAIITTMTDQFGDIPEMVIKEIGYGSGKRKSLDGLPNLLRVIIGEGLETENLNKIDLSNRNFNIDNRNILQINNPNILQETVYVIETSIDDMNPEIAGYIMEKLFENGALDVSYSPLFMKKNRPAFRLEVICQKANLNELIEVILIESTSSGVRFYSTNRAVLARKEVEIDSCFGKIAAKKITDPKGIDRIVPEYEVCRKISREQNIPIKDVYFLIDKRLIKH